MKKKMIVAITIGVLVGFGLLGANYTHQLEMKTGVPNLVEQVVNDK